MGSGVSIGISSALKVASSEEVSNLLMSIPITQRNRVRAALAETEQIAKKPITESDSEVLTYTAIQDLEQRLECAGQLLELSRACDWKQYDLNSWRSLIINTSEVFVALQKDIIVACCLRASFDSVDGKYRFSGGGMMLVHPDLRRRGVAKHLCTLMKQRAEGLGHVYLLGVATALGRPLYEIFGCKAIPPTSSCGRLSAPCSIAANLLSDDSIEVLICSDPPSVNANLAVLVALDSQATGLDRTQVLTNLSKSKGSLLGVASQGGSHVGACLATLDNLTMVWNIGPLIGTEPVANALIRSIGNRFPDGSLAFFVNNHPEYYEALTIAGFDATLPIHTGLMASQDVSESIGDRSKYIAIITPALG